jgi:predicted amidohydrolase
MFAEREKPMLSPEPRGKGSVRVGCITWPRRPKGSVTDLSANAADALAALGALSLSRPDIICLPEGFLYSGIQRTSAASVAVDEQAEVLKGFARAAKTVNSYVAVPLLERSGEAIYNVVALFNREGVRIGSYRKRMLWPSDETFTRFEDGVMPGDGGGPFETEFGRIGIRVCLEVHWPDAWRSLHQDGVRLVLFPSEQGGGILLRQRAWQARCFVVSAVSKGSPSQVIDPLGNVVAEWWPETPASTIDLGLCFELVHFDHNEEKLKQLISMWGSQVEVTPFPAERLYRVTCWNPALDLGEILKERGILTLDQYLDRINEGTAALRLSAAQVR